MPQITIQVKNAQLVARGLSNIRLHIPKINEKIIKKVADAVVREMKIYPPPADSGYVRTYRLKNSWRVKRMANGYKIEGDPVSPRGVHYGRYVVGTAAASSGVNGQAWMHVGRWLLFRDVVDYQTSKLSDEISEHIRLKVKEERLG
jgi:hypothetical protein